jgi:hypothetical protein
LQGIQERALDLGDQATGTTVLRELHQRHGTHPVTVDLEALWSALGVRLRGGCLLLDDTAPLASLRGHRGEGAEEGFSLGKNRENAAPGALERRSRSVEAAPGGGGDRFSAVNIVHQGVMCTMLTVLGTLPRASLLG